MKSRLRSSRKTRAFLFSFKTLQFLRLEVLPVIGIYVLNPPPKNVDCLWSVLLHAYLSQR